MAIGDGAVDGSGAIGDRGSPEMHSTSMLAVLRGLSTADRILGLYEYGIEGCAQESEAQVSAVLLELLASIDLQYGEIAEGFFRLYDYCLERTREGEFDQVAWILEDLRTTWASSVDETQTSAAASIAHAG